MKDWSPGGQVYYLDGWAWGVNRHGKTIALGKADDIQELLAGDKHSDNPIIENIIRADRNNC